MVSAEVTFIDGCMGPGDFIAVAGQLDALDPEEFDLTRMFFYSPTREPRWTRYELELDIVSICYWPERAGLCSLARDGAIHIMDRSGGTEERIADAESHGALTQIRAIAGHLHVCGTQGQVYRRDDKGWRHIDRGILDPQIDVAALHLTSIDGTSASDLYAVGFRGRMLHYDGRSWRDLAAPTNVHLERVLCVGANVYACGNGGVLLKKTAQGIEDHTTSAVTDDFWGLAELQGLIYLASLNGLYAFDGSAIRPVDTGLAPPIGGYRLDARDGRLWSFGAGDLAVFDGRTWTRVVHPDNAEDD